MNIKKLEINFEYDVVDGFEEKRWVLSLVCRQVPDKDDRKFTVCHWEQRDVDKVSDTVAIVRRVVDIINIFDNGIVLGDGNLCHCDWCHTLKHHIVEIVEKGMK